jgi:peptide/nickel transport system ATP-binding protein
MAEQRCIDEEPELLPVVGGTHAAACHFSDRLAGLAPEDLFQPTAIDDVIAELEEQP